MKNFQFPFLKYLLQVESVWDVVHCEESWDQMSDWASFPTVGTELEGAQAMLSIEDTRDRISTSIKIVVFLYSLYP